MQIIEQMMIAQLVKDQEPPVMKKQDGKQKKPTYKDVARNGKPGGSDDNNSGFRVFTHPQAASRHSERTASLSKFSS